MPSRSGIPPGIIISKRACYLEEAARLTYRALALGRAIANADTDGFVKVVVDAETKEVLGIHVVGNGASDIIAEAALAIEMGALAEDIALTIHAHPTLPEAVMEAAKASLGEAIHIQNR